MIRVIAVLLLTLGVAGAAAADEAAVRQAIQAKFPTMRVDGVAATPYAGLYEVIVDGEIVYTDAGVNFLFGGNLYDVRTLPPRNITQERSNAHVAATLGSAARELAIRRVKGNGTRQLYIFEDPNCGFCKSLHRELEKVDDVTIYTFLLPLLSQDSVDKSIAVWCSADRGRAWDELMGRGSLPEGGKACPHPLKQVAALAERFQVKATPAIFLSNGQHIGGMRSAMDIEKAFSAIR